MSLKEGKEEYVGEFGGRKGKGKLYHAIISIIKEIINKAKITNIFITITKIFIRRKLDNRIKWL